MCLCASTSHPQLASFTPRLVLRRTSMKMGCFRAHSVLYHDIIAGLIEELARITIIVGGGTASRSCLLPCPALLYRQSHSPFTIRHDTRIVCMARFDASARCRTEAEGPSRKTLWEEARVPFGLQSLPEAAFRLRRPRYSASELTRLLYNIRLIPPTAYGTAATIQWHKCRSVCTDIYAQLALFVLRILGRYHIIVTFTGASQGQTVGSRPLSCYYRRVQVINRLVLRATELLEPPTRQTSAIKELHCLTGELSIGVLGASRHLRELQMFLYKSVVFFLGRDQKYRARNGSIQYEVTIRIEAPELSLPGRWWLLRGLQIIILSNAFQRLDPISPLYYLPCSVTASGLLEHQHKRVQLKLEKLRDDACNGKRAARNAGGARPITAGSRLLASYVMCCP
ncbi:hypothetical protein TRIATDRAFT_87259 [Trichoderma atroviride IMI 206040]|uniref:Uncharacterized protein n=1 Tax=Hypocrea atroviridis (strain ATCC 20476 / IMI 206040) TaxID=452589 RepID=G9NXL3_HYPAI|nr:uncharacterized protein TRIATDRAFT_87259 [Trichoderma atroviride IMI 206040]EHK44193.1 hypothetical protein TRIATDRAFT_87259 [Trichoderma atroviride IMI 206040]